MSRNTMARQHFQLIAEVIRQARTQATRDYKAAELQRPVDRAKALARESELVQLAEHFAYRLADTNNGFRREQFLQACDPKEEYRPKGRGSNQHSVRDVRRAALAEYSDSEISDRMTSAYRGESVGSFEETAEFYDNQPNDPNE